METPQVRWVHVLSTGFETPTEAIDRCLLSVREQVVDAKVEHHWNVANVGLPLPHFEFLSRVVSSLPPDEICVSVDLDDHLSTPSALAIIARAHELGAWMTYGSYKFSDGRPGHAAPGNPDTCRKDPWVMSHTKSFRAGLFQRIKSEHLKMGGGWLPHGRDLALMFPMAELAGPAHCIFLPQVTYVYHLETSGEWTGGKTFQEEERRCVDHVRSLPRYERLTSL